MRAIDAGTTGTAGDAEDLAPAPAPPADWAAALRLLTGGHPLRPIQRRALDPVLKGRRHLIISAPTGGGKSLVGQVALLEALRRRRHGILVTPLRVLVESQTVTLTELLSRAAPTFLPDDVQIHPSTSDLPLDPAAMEGGAPRILVTTPEGLDALWRRSGGRPWMNRVGAVVVDEAHLVAADRRGPALEHVIATCLTQRQPPRLILMSATLSATDRMMAWLHPCDLIETRARHAPLHRQVLALEADEDADHALVDLIDGALEAPEHQALVFVYRREDAVRLADKLSGARAYHGGMDRADRDRTRARFLHGQCRVVVTTTALAMGVDLPATHVIVRDTTFHGHGRLAVDSLHQMLGRAGRGTLAGRGYVMVRPTDRWDPDALADAITRGDRAEVRSTLPAAPSGATPVEAIADLVTARLAGGPPSGMTRADLETHVGHTLAGPGLVDHVQRALVWLGSPHRALLDRDRRGRYRLSPLGARGAQVMWPLGWTAGVGQLLRDLLTSDPEDEVLGTLTAVDPVVIGALLMGRDDPPPSREDAGSISRWLSKHPGHSPTLFTRWASGGPNAHGAQDLLGSLGLDLGRGPHGGERAWARLVRATRQAISLCAEPDRGPPWAVDRATQRMRDPLGWWLRGFAALSDLEVVDAHLRAEGADGQRLARIHRHLGRLRRQAWSRAGRRGVRSVRDS